MSKDEKKGKMKNSLWGPRPHCGSDVCVYTARQKVWNVIPLFAHERNTPALDVTWWILETASCLLACLADHVRKTNICRLPESKPIGNCNLYFERFNLQTWHFKMGCFAKSCTVDRMFAATMLIHAFSLRFHLIFLSAIGVKI